MFRRSLLALALVAVAACSTLNDPKDIKAFGDAATTSANGFEAFTDDTRALAQSVGDQDAADGVLASIGSRSGFPTSPEPGEMIGIEFFKERQEALDALVDYAKALSAASDQKKVDALKASARGLGNATADFAALAPGGGALAAPVFKLAGEGLGVALASRYAREVNGVIEAVNPHVQWLSGQLSEDVPLFQKSLNQSLRDYKVKRKRAVAKIRSDPRTSKAEAYQAYLDMLDDIRAAEARVVAWEKLPAVMERLGTAHDKLANRAPDVKQALKDLQSAAAATKDVVDAIRR